MNLLDKILEEQGINYEDLNHAERETYNRANFNMKTLSVGQVLENIVYMKNSVALQLANTPISETDTIVALQGRLKNYILQESFLSSPEVAEKAFREAMEKKGSR